MKFCTPIHTSQGADKRHPKPPVPSDGLDHEKPTRHHRRPKSQRSSLDTRSISPPSTMPPSSSNRSISGVSRRSRSSRRESSQTEDDGSRLRSRSSYQRDRSCKPISRGKSQSRFSSQHQFSDPACPFDDNGYCVIHKDVRMAKLKCDQWRVVRNECPKCLKVKGSNLSGSLTDRTESSTQDESFDSPPQSSSRRKSVRPSYRDNEQEVRRSGNSFYSIDESKEITSRRKSVRPSYRDEQQEVRKSGNSFYSIDESRETSSRRTNPRLHHHDETMVRRSNNSFHSTRSRNDDVSQNGRSRSQRSVSVRYEDYENQSCEEEDIDNDSYDNRSRRHSRGREDRARSKSRPKMPRSSSRGALSRVSRSSRSGGDHRSEKYVSRPKPKTICVNGVPFDKNGCCFLHPHVKLASKKLLGGWKVHHTFCKACAVDSHCDDDDQSSALTSRSGYSSRSRGTSHHSDYSDYSDVRSAAASVVESVRSLRSNISTASWTSNQSRKRVQNNDSFLPLDKDGYCTHHPDVQLAKLGKRGEWKVLMDFCPECAEASLMIGGAPGNKSSKSSKSRSSRRNCDESTVKSSKSNQSDKMFVEKMPFIDNDGKPGHYTGYLNLEGRPNGRGKMKYVDGKKFDGVWKEGNQIQGKVSYKKTTDKDKSASSEKKKKTRRSERL